MLWFTTAIAKLSGIDVKSACKRSLEFHSNLQLPEFSTYKELQGFVNFCGGKISMVDYEIITNEPRYFELSENPLGIFVSLSNRLPRLINPEDFPTYRGSTFEPDNDIELAIGDHINAIAYISSILRWDINQIAQNNIQKISQRQIMDKQPV